MFIAPMTFSMSGRPVRRQVAGVQQVGLCCSSPRPAANWATASMRGNGGACEAADAAAGCGGSHEAFGDKWVKKRLRRDGSAGAGGDQIGEGRADEQADELQPEERRCPEYTAFMPMWLGSVPSTENSV